MNFKKFFIMINLVLSFAVASDLQPISSGKLVNITTSETSNDMSFLSKKVNSYILYLSWQRPSLNVGSTKVFLNLITEFKTFSIPLFEGTFGTGFKSYDTFNDGPIAPYDRMAKYQNTIYGKIFSDIQFYIFSKQDELNSNLSISEWACANASGGNCTNNGNFKMNYELIMTPYLATSIKLLKDYAGIATIACVNKIIFAKNPSTHGWAKFYSNCDIPSEWEQSLSEPISIKDEQSDTPKSAESYEKIQANIVSLKDVGISLEGNLIKITMPVEKMFDSGSAVLKLDGMIQLKKITESFDGISYKEIRVEGHTDSVPTKGKYPSNWELSSARSANVVKYMTEHYFDPKMLAAIGYADSRPIALNTSSEGRARNRRIEFTLVLNNQ
jgi:outer membrane protein OmpA-like peptidoglycan-associated protein